ncbi:MAG: GAF domain-containing protein [Anaerolineae bacterium]|nr:GAF domain-containing protein [Anaerolineae bacterium]
MLSLNKLPSLSSYGLAVLLVGLATGLTMLLTQLSSRKIFALFYVAVILSAWRGGLGPGLLATFLSAVVGSYLLIPPTFSFVVDLPGLVQVATFLLVALLISSLTAARKRAEAALAEREKQLRLIIDTTPALISYIGADLRYRFNNRTYETWFGSAVTNIPGQHVREVLGEAAYEALRPNLETALAGQPVSFEQLVAYRTGGPRYVQLTYTPHFDEQDEVRGLVVLVTDITERKQAEVAEQQARQAIEEMAERIISLQDLTAALAEALTPAQVASIIIEHGLPVLGAAGGVVTRLSEDQAELEIVHFDGYSPQRMAQWGQRIPVSIASPLTEAVQTGEASFIESPAELAARYPHLAEQRVSNNQAFVALPLNVEGRSIGAIGLSFAEPQTFSDEDSEFMLTLARQCAQALERARLYEAERQARQAAEETAKRITSLQAVTARLSKAITPPEIIQIIFTYGLAAVEADGSTFALLTDEGDEFVIVDAIGYPAEAVDPWRRFPAQAQTPMGDVVRSGLPLFFNSREDVAVRYTDVRASGKGHDEAWAVLPLIGEKGAIGAVSIGFAEARVFSPEEQGFLLTLTRQCAQALERAHLYEAERQARLEAEALQHRLALLAEVRERNRLAQELHDTVAQALGYLNLKISLTHTLLAEGQVEAAQANLRELKNVVGETYTDVREEIFSLKSNVLADTGFMEMLERYIDKYRRFYNLEIQLVQGADPALFEFSPEVTPQVIRTIQEALINIRKHAYVDTAIIRLGQERGHVRISIEDEGRGFDLAKIHEKPTSFGLQIMRERVESVGGTLEIDSALDQGTRVTLRFRQTKKGQV